MLREYRLTNFKAFGETVTLPIRPLTLIFGANSSGKSSIFQSLLLLKQTLEESKNPATALLPKGSLVDLGTYADFVHRHETDRDFGFSAHFDLTRPLVLSSDETVSEARLDIRFACAGGIRIPYPSYGKIAFGQDLRPIASYASSDEVPRGVAKMLYHESEHEFWIRWWNAFHRCYEKRGRAEHLAFLMMKNFNMNDKEAKEWTEKSTSSDWEKAKRKEEDSIQEEYLDTWIPEMMNEGEYEYENFLLSDSEPSIHRVARTTDKYILYYWIDLPIIRTLSSFRRALENLVYLGPLRSHPERYYIFSSTTYEQVGQSGENSPSLLLQNPKLLKSVNKDLNRIGVKYQLCPSELRSEDDVSSNVFSLTLVDKHGIPANMRDVGFGISQVLPIVVQNRLSEQKTLLIEQPEIHLHPAHQSELGDMFIKSALGERRNTLLLETHSEHLILRILRRIRETTENGSPSDEGIPPIRPEDVAVLYVQPGKEGARVIEIPVTEDGDFARNWPGGFFSERVADLF